MSFKEGDILLRLPDQIEGIWAEKCAAKNIDPYAPIKVSRTTSWGDPIFEQINKGHWTAMFFTLANHINKKLEDYL